MKRLGAFIDPCGAQHNMLIANGAKRETGTDGHIATSGEEQKQNPDGPAITLA